MLWLVPTIALLTPAPGSAQQACSRTRIGGQPLRLSPLLVATTQPASDPTRDYRHLLRTTVQGWPLQTPWCVWVEPAREGEEPGGPSAATTAHWHEAVARALAEWARLLPIERVSARDTAQVTVWRRRPPLGRDPAGRPRASHGRSTLSLVLQGSGQTPEGPARLEPRVEVLVSPGQRMDAIQATALHELGHAFGLWGHSDNPADAMAVSPGSRPILRLSPRDEATVRWLYLQPSPMRSNP